MDLGLTDKVAIVTGSSRGLGLASARALVAEGCRVCLCARGEERLAEAALEVEAAAKRPNLVATVQADVSTRDGVERVIEKAVETFGGLDVLVNNVGRAGGARSARHVRRRLAGGVRRDAVSGDPRVAARRAAHAPARRRRDRHDCLHLRSRSRRPHDLQRRESGRDQPRQVARAAARAAQHPRQQRRARIDPLPRRFLVPAPAGRSRRASPTSSAASCRSAASGVPTKSAPPSRSSPLRAPAGSAARASRSMGVRDDRISDGHQLSAVSYQLSAARALRSLADRLGSGMALS